MSDELDCSEGAKIMIERIRSNPEEFAIAGRFSAIAGAVLGPSDTRRPLSIPGMGVTISRRDRVALMEALEVHAEEAFTVQVVAAIIGGNKTTLQTPRPEYDSLYQSHKPANNALANIGMSGYQQNYPAEAALRGLQNATLTAPPESQQSYFGKLLGRRK